MAQQRSTAKRRNGKIRLDGRTPMTVITYRPGDIKTERDVHRFLSEYDREHPPEDHFDTRLRERRERAEEEAKSKQSKEAEAARRQRAQHPPPWGMLSLKADADSIRAASQQGDRLAAHWARPKGGFFVRIVRTPKWPPRYALAPATLVRPGPGPIRSCIWS
jgi:hypothetical protein